MKVNWLQLIEFFLSLAVTELPAAIALIPGLAASSDEHQAAVNVAVSAALSAKKAA